MLTFFVLLTVIAVVVYTIGICRIPDIQGPPGEYIPDEGAIADYCCD